jgi:hypothetical protein
MPNVQQIELSEELAAFVESGALQIGPRPPGYYLAGDEARLLALDVAVLLSFIRGKKGMCANAMQVAVRSLEKFHDRVREDLGA